jgi:hypothetical protein
VLNEAGIIRAILDGDRGYLFTCFERSVASIEKVLKWHAGQRALQQGCDFRVDAILTVSEGWIGSTSIGWMLAFRQSRFGGQRAVSRGRDPELMSSRVEVQGLEESRCAGSARQDGLADDVVTGSIITDALH